MSLCLRDETGYNFTDPSAGGLGVLVTDTSLETSVSILDLHGMQFVSACES